MLSFFGRMVFPFSFRNRRWTGIFCSYSYGIFSLGSVDFFLVHCFFSSVDCDLLPLYIFQFKYELNYMKRRFSVRKLLNFAAKVPNNLTRKGDSFCCPGMFYSVLQNDWVDWSTSTRIKTIEKFLKTRFTKKWHWSLVLRILYAAIYNFLVKSGCNKLSN